MRHLKIPPAALSWLPIALSLLLLPGSITAQTEAQHGGHDAQPPVTDPAHAPAAHDGRSDANEPAAGPRITEADLDAGRMIYEMSCIFCHGSQGRGDGGAAIYLGPYSHPRPNNLTAATFKFRSTHSGQAPLLTDLMRTIRHGIPGFMPSYRNLGENGIRQVAAYIAATFIPTPLATESTITWPDYPGAAAQTPDSMRRGKRLYEELGCATCHGADGRKSMAHMLDQRGLSVMPMDLTRPETFGNGHSPEDIYRTLMTGLDGTPMPGYADAFKGTEEQVWDLVHYILSLREG